MCLLLAVTLWKIAEDDEHLTIISGLHAIKNNFFLLAEIYLDRSDRCIMKLQGNVILLKEGIIIVETQTRGES